MTAPILDVQGLTVRLPSGADRMKKACDNVKNAGVIVYSIQVIDGNDALLKGCASDASKYFKINNSNQIVSVFTQIATTLSRLRVAQ